MTSSSPVSGFYAPPNEIDPSDLDSTRRELITSLTARLVSSRLRTVLPARVAGAVRWYGLAPSHREARLLREELRCWLGPPIAQSTTEIQSLADPVDRAADALVPDGAAIRVDVAVDWQTQARSNVASLTDTWALAPERGVDQPRPVGRLLRQFYEGVLAADRASAERAVDEIKSRALLSATNIRFLRVELLGSLGTPEELRDDPMLQDISSLARPAAVTERLADAADALFVRPTLGRSAGSENWTDVARTLDTAWPSLVTHPDQVTTIATARCFVLHEVLATAPRHALMREVSARFADDPVVRAVVPSDASPPEAQQRSVPALESYLAADYWAALQAVESGGRQPSAVAVALAAAINIGDSAAAVRALALVDALDGQDREQLLANAAERAFYDQLLARTSAAKVPGNWLDWLRGEWRDRPDLLAEWASHWRRDDVLHEDDGALAIELLDALHDERRGRVRNGLPILIEWLIDDELPPSAVGLATTIVDILLSSEPGRTERGVALTLLEAVLVVGCNSEEYGELIEAVSGQLPLLGARDASWLAECLDVFMLCSSADAPRRSALLAEAAGTATAWIERLQSSDVVVLHQLFADAGIKFAPVDRTAQAERLGAHLTSIGIYSLLESAVRVATERIQRLFPGVDVRASSAHVNNTQIAAVVRGVDVMLVQTSHAKHAATDAIKAAAPDPSKIVLVNGRGATALVRALLGWVQGGAARSS